MSELTAQRAKTLAREALEQANAPYEKLSAKKVSFEGLGYGSAYFVKVTGWTPGPHNGTAKNLAPKGVILEFK